jgi:hypothetical protein
MAAAAHTSHSVSPAATCNCRRSVQCTTCRLRTTYNACFASPNVARCRTAAAAVRLVAVAQLEPVVRNGNPTRVCICSSSRSRSCRLVCSAAAAQVFPRCDRAGGTRQGWWARSPGAPWPALTAHGHILNELCSCCPPRRAAMILWHLSTCDDCRCMVWHLGRWRRGPSLSTAPGLSSARL